MTNYNYKKAILMTLLIVPLFTAGILIVGLQQASAGGGSQDCGSLSPTVAPDMIDETLQPGESVDVTKVFDPDEEECEFEGFDTPPFTKDQDCSGSGFDDNILIDVDQVNDNEWDETITVNDDAEPERYHCTLIWTLVYENDRGDEFNITVNQEIWITVPDPVILVHIDIKPESCPNPVNSNSRGLLPVAILGSADFDVSQIDVETILLEVVSPVKHNIEDVATPHTPDTAVVNPNDCTIDGPDGIDDLTLKFDTFEVVSEIGLARGSVVQLLLTGNLLDGTEIHGYDTIIVK